MIKKIKQFFGIEATSVSLAEHLVSTLGGVLGIILVYAISYYYVGGLGSAVIVPSMGASAVLLFAVPHGKLSQPWALIGGHVISAIVGVTCAQYIGNIFIAAGLAVGLAIGAMHLFRCIHPPGGATAIAAVIGGPAIFDSGYQFVLTPILLNTLIIFIVAVLFNSVLPWRRYPVSLMRFTDAPGKNSDTSGTDHAIEKQFIEQALEDMDVVVDLTSSDLQQIFTLAHAHAESAELSVSQIKLGHYYTNNKHGGEWSVRQIIDESVSNDPNKDMVIYRIAEGSGYSNADSCTRVVFARWAVRELYSTHDSNLTKEG
ncbi:MAG: HPP family protein [Gammaproteobacteria bacterium]